jgi:hypothetical protein
MTLSIFVIHYLFDWVFQSRKIAENKSRSVKVLTQHVLIYGAGLSLLTFFGASWYWVALNTLAHFVVDFFTSKASSWAFQNNKPLFWKIIGFDQMLHYLILFSTL